ncbi:hypothetical protein ZRA01_04530 [Zoogloea ramigera]|uniref:Uncharacterized protein n=1 Tax=Zoogloea ramigera TaxID=350 RepID=A0A4Y4CUW0_ZOORA|nr:hypothetical protein ZRA01_04530 [Zoogloea ramigera]
MDAPRPPTVPASRDKNPRNAASHAGKPRGGYDGRLQMGEATRDAVGMSRKRIRPHILRISGKPRGRNCETTDERKLGNSQINS